MEKLFSGKTVLVTGSGKKNGIGYGIAKHLADNGANLVLTDVANKKKAGNQKVGDEPKSELTQNLEELRLISNNHLAIEADLTKPEDIVSLFDRIENELGPVSILVNNAGICPVKPLLNTSSSEWEITLKINATGVFLCSIEATKRMIKSGIRGSIINMSSISGKEGWPD
ncbi:MAG TPA: hypothetical protein DCG34_00165, partial [Clostridiales bacterium]|nr:hypothetical protein [Clostridiales bacterium]